VAGDGAGGLVSAPAPKPVGSVCSLSLASGSTLCDAGNAAGAAGAAESADPAEYRPALADGGINEESYVRNSDDRSRVSLRPIDG
jgi:hypothetical protein